MLGDMECKIEQTGETITFTVTPVGFDVACWDKEDANRWTKHFGKYESDAALAEFERWGL